MSDEDILSEIEHVGERLQTAKAEVAKRVIGQEKVVDLTMNALYLDADGYLHITGRASEKIISGGENIFPAEVEAALRKTNQVLDVCVVGLPHPDWGEAVAAAYVPANETVSPATLKAALTYLSRYKHPKRWFSVPALPRNAQGKLNRSMVLEHPSLLSSEATQV